MSDILRNLRSMQGVYEKSPESFPSTARMYKEAADEIERLSYQLVKARAALERIEQIGLRAPTFSAAIQPGNIAHAALIELFLTDEKNT